MITIDHMHFEIIENYRDAFDEEQFREKYSEVLNKYDYIVGDIGYEKLRLAGFFRDDKAKVDRDKKFSAVQDYLYEYCNFGCAYFVLRKVTKSEIKEMKDRGEFEEPAADAEPVQEETPASDRQASDGKEPDADTAGPAGESGTSRQQAAGPEDQGRGNRQSRRKKSSRGKKKTGQHKQKQNSIQKPPGKTFAEHQSSKKPD